MTEILNPSVSADGRRNAFVLHCKPLEQRMNYAACLARVDLIATGTFPKDLNSCDSQCSLGRCIAKDMRQEEQLQGRAIYFLARTGVREAAEKVIDYARERIANVVAKVTPKRSATPARAAATSLLDTLASTSTDYADALTAAATELKTAATPRPSPVIDVQRDETPLQAARRALAAKQLKETTLC